MRALLKTLISNCSSDARAAWPELTGESTWRAVFAPAGTPADIVAKIANDLRRVLATTDVRDRFQALSMEVEWSPGDELGRRVRTETEKWGRLVKETGITFAQ